MISICLCMPPVNSYAANILGHVQMILLKHDGSPKKAGDVNGNIGMADMTEDVRQVSSMDNHVTECEYDGGSKSNGMLPVRK